MYQADVQPVLRCEQCNKPFDKESTLKRHGYYCRSRRSGVTIRPRACTSCSKGKARCDNRLPECSRCLSKGIRCHYPPKHRNGTAPRTQHTNHVPPQQRNEVASLATESTVVQNPKDVSKTDDVGFEAVLDASESLFAGLDNELFDPNIDFIDFTNLQADDSIDQAHSPGGSPFALQSTSSTNGKSQVQQAFLVSRSSIPRVPTSTVRSFTRQSNTKTGTQRVANLILHTLKSYPLMMLRYDNLPPFIHQHSISRGLQDEDVEPLTNCLSLVHMRRSQFGGTRKLFWKNVRLECERLCAECQQLNGWQLLAAMQALSIYILIRLDEGETDHNNLDSLLVATVTMLAMHFNTFDLTCHTQSALYSYDSSTSWKNWIFEESIRRICVIYQVMGMLVHFEPAALCDLQTGLVLAPLPSKKQLWEASDELAWMAESEKEPALPTTYGLAANGDLVRVEDGPVLPKSLQFGTPPDQTANWEDWCAGMDGLGGLVMLAASLIAQ